MTLRTASRIASACSGGNVVGGGGAVVVVVVARTRWTVRGRPRLVDSSLPPQAASHERPRTRGVDEDRGGRDARGSHGAARSYASACCSATWAEALEKVDDTVAAFLRRLEEGAEPSAISVTDDTAMAANGARAGTAPALRAPAHARRRRGTRGAAARPRRGGGRRRSAMSSACARRRHALAERGLRTLRSRCGGGPPRRAAGVREPVGAACTSSTSRCPVSRRFEHHVVRVPRPAVGCVVHDPDRGVLLLWRHRFITDTWGWEIPAGGVDEGESPEAAAARETLEETGWRPGPLAPLMLTYHPSNGLTNQVFHLLRRRRRRARRRPDRPGRVRARRVGAGARGAPDRRCRRGRRRPLRHRVDVRARVRPPRPTDG